MSAANEISIVRRHEEHFPSASQEAGSSGSGDTNGARAVDINSSAAVRRRLPDERHSLTHHLSVGGQEGYVTVGLYEDGLPGELFIRMAKEGSTVSGLILLRQGTDPKGTQRSNNKGRRATGRGSASPERISGTQVASPKCGNC